VGKDLQIPTKDLKMNERSFDFKGSTIFDLNFNYIGLPQKLFDEVFNLLSSYMHCYAQGFKRYCDFLGNINILPIIQIEPEDSDELIKIPPRLYLIQNSTSVLELLLVGTSDNEKDIDNVYVTPEYSNRIILGSPFLEYYYVIF